MKKLTNILTIIALIVIVVLIGTISFGYYKKVTMEVKNPIVTMEVENFGTIKMELYPDQAPEAVSNFIKLANNGFYDGTQFHRIVKDFMVQAGTKNGDGTTDATIGDLKGTESTDKYSIKGEFLANNVNNTIKFEEGTLAMARADYTQYSSSLKSQSYNSGCSQFFIMTADNASLDGYYAPFGKVIEGMDIVHKIEKVEVKEKESTSSSSDSSSSEQKEKSTPVNDVIISKVSVETYGVDYGKPETLDTWNYNDWVYKTYGINLNQYQQ